MREFIKKEENNSNKFTVITIGTFDGVHLGHQKILNRLIEISKKEKLNSVVLTLFPHPRMVLQQDANVKLINTIEERGKILDNLGIDFLVVKKFTTEFSRLSAEEFVSTILVNELNIKKIVIGYDHRFGKNRSANIEDLKTFGKQFNFEVEEISALDVNEVTVSSTKIRQALENGNIKKANLYLGYNFMLTGKVIKGKGLGRQLNFPTANIYIEETYKLIPKQGVYVISSNIEGNTIFGMMNIGTNPTFNGTSESIEVHFFNFNKDIYDTKLTLEILHRLRDEEKFNSIEALKTQLQKDQDGALNFIATSHAK